MYKIVFDTCGPYTAGDVVPGSALGNVAYLLRIGAVVPVEDPQPTPTAALPAGRKRR